jgi:hypothetical protein
VALILTSIVDEQGSIDDFVGHPSEAQFVIITVPAKVDDLARHIKERLGQAMAYFYPIHDREAGFVTWGSAPTRRAKIPFMSVVTTRCSDTPCRRAGLAPGAHSLPHQSNSPPCLWTSINLAQAHAPI